jgi:hypothetical protein
VNDYSSDDERQRLAVLASDLTIAGPLPTSVQQAMTRRCLLSALPYSSGSRRRVIAVALLGLDRAAAGSTAGYSAVDVSLDTEFALIGCDTAVSEAVERLELLPVDLDQHHKRGLAAAIELAVATIAEEATDADELLYRLLVSCLDDHRSSGTRPGVALGDDRDRIAARREITD